MNILAVTARLYGWQHILYLVLVIAAAAVSLTLVKLKVKSDKTVDFTVKILGGVLLALIIFNRIAIACHREDGWGLVPESFCGVGSLCLALCCIFCKRGSLPYHAFVYWMFMGGLIVIFYPDFLGQKFHGEATSFMYPATISGMLHHALSCYITVFLFLTGHFKPCLKKTYILPVALCASIAYGTFLKDALSFEEAMYIGKPLIKGTFISWYVVDPALVAGAYGLAYLYEYLTKKKQLKKPADEGGEQPDGEGDGQILNDGQPEKGN